MRELCSVETAKDRGRASRGFGGPMTDNLYDPVSESAHYLAWNEGWKEGKDPKTNEPPIHKFATGAIRGTGDLPRYDLVSPIGLRRLAEAHAEGTRKYGCDNWLKGIPCSNLFNHLLTHLEMWKKGDQSEDHLGHAAWNLFAIMHFEETRPELLDSELIHRSKTFVRDSPHLSDQVVNYAEDYRVGTDKLEEYMEPLNNSQLKQLVRDLDEKLKEEREEHRVQLELQQQ